MKDRINLAGILGGLIVGIILGVGGTVIIQGQKIAQLQVQVESLSKISPLAQAQSEKKTINKSEGHSSFPTSSDGKYQAKQVALGNSEHYQIIEIGTGRIVMTTKAQYSTANYVRAGLFSPDSKRFAAAYHYGNESDAYTWVGIWDIESGNIINTKRQSGWTNDIYWVFSEE